MSAVPLREFFMFAYPQAQAGAEWVAHLVPCFYTVPQELPAMVPYEATAIFAWAANSRDRRHENACAHRLVWAACDAPHQTPVGPLLQLVVRCALLRGAAAIEVRESLFMAANILLSIFRFLNYVPWEDARHLRWNQRPAIDEVVDPYKNPWRDPEEAKCDVFDAACLILHYAHRI